MRLGVIVGRFQVPDLHPAHHMLITQAMRENDQLLIVVGESHAKLTNKNPMDAATRIAMLSGHYPDALFATIKDRSTDLAWSRDLDTLVNTYVKSEGEDTVTMYCGRDGFKSAYRGRFDVVEIDSIAEYNGTELRAGACGKVVNSTDFRKGVIYATDRKYNLTYPTVDVAVINKGSVLVGRRPGEGKFRIPGGFVGVMDTSLENAAIRELYEETEVTVPDKSKLTYIKSTHIKDFRYNGPDARIMTTLFAVDYTDTLGHHQVDDDEFDELAWIPLSQTESFAESHLPLIFGLQDYVNNKEN